MVFTYPVTEDGKTRQTDDAGTVQTSIYTVNTGNLSSSLQNINHLDAICNEDLPLIVADKWSNYWKWLALSLYMGTSTRDVHLLRKTGLIIPVVEDGLAIP
jgi:hypothetical protein